MRDGAGGAEDGDRTRGSITGRTGLLAGALVAVVLFLFGVRLLGAATAAATPVLERWLTRFVRDAPSALGLAWLVTYGITNGSVVAALGVSLFDAGVVTDGQLFLLVAGSRLGGAAIVVFVGALDYLQRRQTATLGESTRLGVLTFLATHSVYLPATVIGYVALPWTRTALAGVGAAVGFEAAALSVFERATDRIVDAVGPLPAVGVALAVLLGGLALFDRVLAGADETALRDRVFSRFERPWLAALAGLAVTTASTSVAFSIGLVVPLYNRGYVTREEILPYVLGANLGTLFDTVLVAVLLDAGVGVGTVLGLLAAAVVVTLPALVWFRRYAAAVGATLDAIEGSRARFGAFLAALVAVPAVLVAL
ncbi:MAG: sodium:phosphate symporter [Haloarculaceae archaeon]